MPRKPNFIIVFMDDMGYGDMGCFDSPAIRTPNMDRLADEGIRFTQMYSASAVCSPSRTALTTGRQPTRVGIERVLFPRDTNGIGDDETTVADDLRTAGYRTAMAGKWHMGCLPQHNPVRHGFEEYFGLLYSNDMDPLHLYRNEEAIETEVDQATLTRRYTDFVIEFIEQHRDEPFLAYLAHTMPHIPLHVEPDFRGVSAGGTYGDTIECIDHHLGRLLDKLDELGIADDTVVIVTSDNGPWFEGSTGGLRGRKFDLYEGGIRMPFVARRPGCVGPGAVCETPASLMDLRPTLDALAGAAPPEGTHLDGIDISPVFDGGEMPEREALYWYQGWNLNAMRMDRWKLHVRDGQNENQMPQLFDMEIDPEEAYNVADLHPDLVERMKGMMARFDEPIQAGRPPAEE